MNDSTSLQFNWKNNNNMNVNNGDNPSGVETDSGEVNGMTMKILVKLVLEQLIQQVNYM